MIKKNIIIKNELGLHARASNKLSNLASKYSANIEIVFNDQAVDAKNMMDILLLSIGVHDNVIIKASGVDEKKAVQSIEKLIENLFGEGK